MKYNLRSEKKISRQSLEFIFIDSSKKMNIKRHTTTEISLVALDVQNFAARREEHFQFNKCLFDFNGD